MIKTYRPVTCNCSQYIESNVSANLTLGHHYGQGGDGALIVYIVDSLSSNSMKSHNPHSGFHETDTVKCLDTACLNPTCNQGGIIVVGQRTDL